ncbi:MAG TPA: TRAM domain-containing protein [Anaerolineaceae bacterium]|nr:TRAM domain-containing protein [Anaerolineaceae bacterium]HPN51096.1 TRAM domain-containing protein [Anaerolineaceae bacterium]
MSIDFIARLVGMVVLCIVGVYWGVSLGTLANINPGPTTFSVEQYAFATGLVGALTGLILTPLITVRPMRALKNMVSRISAETLLASTLGLVTGLLFAALLSFPLSLLPQPFGQTLPFLGVLLFCYFGVAFFVMRQDDLFALISTLFNRGNPATNPPVSSLHTLNEGRSILLDTSVIIDGRIADIARTGFIPGALLIPRFVLNELQYIADSPDGLKRQRGRRGMEVLSTLQKEPTIPVRITDVDVEGVREVDDKLIILARQMHCPVLTNDYNLNRIAELQGVTVLNVNELANAVKSALLPGETITMRVIQEGKEIGQGVGYMDDGTMVVVENGREFMNRQVTVVVTKVLQTAAGRMIFARCE